jgi:hypothetical protein
MTNKRLNCTECAWKTDREACRACRAENRAIGNEDTPGQLERSAYAETDDFKVLGELAEAVKDIKDDTAFNSFLCIAGEQHVHWARHHADETPYAMPKLGIQN